MKPVSNTAMINLAYQTSVDRNAMSGVSAAAMPLSASHPQSLLDLPPGEAILVLRLILLCTHLDMCADCKLR